MTNLPQQRDQETADEAPANFVIVKPLDPKAVTLNASGFCWNEFFVRLPQGIVFGHLVNEPGLWRLIQVDRNKSMKRLDRVTIVDYDESWCATAIVSAASAKGVTLSKPVKTDLDPRTEATIETELYIIRWAGTGYCVERKSDGRRVTSIVASRDLAERDLRALYPTQAA